MTVHVYQWLAAGSGPGIAMMQILVSFFLSAVLGMKLFSRVGLHLLRKAQQQLAMGQVPDRTIGEGLLLLVGAVLLIIPGFLSDLLGLLLILLRGPLAIIFLKFFKKQLEKGRIRVNTFGQTGFSASYRRHPWTQSSDTHEISRERLGETPVVIDVQPLDEKK